MEYMEDVCSNPEFCAQIQNTFEDLVLCNSPFGKLNLRHTSSCVVNFAVQVEIRNLDNKNPSRM
jgi:hypothetical protein